MNEIQIKNKVYWAIGIVISIVVLVVGAFIWNFHDAELAKESDKWGQFGDYIGGTLNPVLAFLSFSALLFTIYIQVKQLNFADEQLKRTLDELNLSRTELGLTRSELQRSADAQTGSKQVMEQQLLTQSMQQFDSIFFAMLRELNSLLAELDEVENEQKSLLDECYITVLRKNVEGIKEPLGELLKDRVISRYFMLLYQLLKNIDDKIDSNGYIRSDKLIIKKTYTNIVRASIPEKLMQLLMLNVLNLGFDRYKDLVEKFSFFEHTSFNTNNSYNLILINASKSINSLAFDKSRYYEELRGSNLYGKFIIDNNIFSISRLYSKIFSELHMVGELRRIQVTDEYNQTNWFYESNIENKEEKRLIVLLDDHFFKPSKIQIKEKGLCSRQNNYTCNVIIRNNEILITEHNYTRSSEQKELLKIIFNDDGSYSLQQAVL